MNKDYTIGIYIRLSMADEDVYKRQYPALMMPSSCLVGA